MTLICQILALKKSIMLLKKNFIKKRLENMVNKKVMIIGAEISGMSAGNYLQMNGYDTEIFELHTKPGGLCTGWRRKGYTIDGCIHWLVGSGPSINYYKFWNELIDMRELEIVDYVEYCSLEDKDGKRLRAFANVDRLEKEMKDIAPEDTDAIEILEIILRSLFN